MSATTYTEFMQGLYQDYFLETGAERATTSELAVWAIRSGRWDPPHDLVLRKCREDFSRALREEYIKDEHGRPVRAKHAARERSGDEQKTFWADIRTADHRHMQVAFAQRREQIVGDCRQLNRDVDFYNSHRQPGNQKIQMYFDFRDDVEEGDFPDTMS